MRPVYLLMGSFVVILGLCGPVSAASNEGEAAVTPPVIYGRPGEDTIEAPRWVSAAAFLIGPGEYRWELFAAHDVERLRRALSPAGKFDAFLRGVVQRLEPETCPILTVTNENAGARTPPYPGLLELMERTEIVVAGTVVNVTPGFMFGDPASLMTIRDLEVIPEGRRSAVPDVIYVPYPATQFALDQTPFCRRDFGGLVTVRGGERVLLFPRAGAVDSDGSLLYADLDEIVFEVSEDGGLELPKNLRVDDELTGVRTLDEILRKVRLGSSRIGVGRSELEP